MHPLWPIEIRLRHKLGESTHRGQGMSVGLYRGLVALHNTQNITGEGLGLGAIAARVGDFTYFGESTCTHKSWRTITKQFQLNRKLPWTVWGRTSPLLTRLNPPPRKESPPPVLRRIATAWAQ